MGHAFNEETIYRFVPTDAAIHNGRIRKSTVVPWFAIEEALDVAKGRRILFIDTCHSAGAYNERLGNSAYHENIITYSSARSDEVAWESESTGHGLFTQAVIEEISGAADLDGDGFVDTMELAQYLRRRVPELSAQLQSKPEQQPQFFRGRDAQIIRFPRHTDLG